MKKLALALVCFASLAFFASCNQEGQPSIQVLVEEGYVQDGAVVDLDTDVHFGFVVASSPVTNYELASLVIKIDGEEYDTKDLTGLYSYTYNEGLVSYEINRDEIVGESMITAVVTDAAGQIATATINLSINQPEAPVQTLEPKDFTWFRHNSNDGEGLAEYGLEWKGNGKEVFAIIKPVDGATLYGFSPEIWDEVTTDAEKVTAFTEGLHSVMSDFRGVSAWNSHDNYDFVIGTIYNNEYHLIHITKGVVANNGSAGTDITITGQSK